MCYSFGFTFQLSTAYKQTLPILKLIRIELALYFVTYLCFYLFSSNRLIAYFKSPQPGMKWLMSYRLGLSILSVCLVCTFVLKLYHYLYFLSMEGTVFIFCELLFDLCGAIVFHRHILLSDRIPSLSFYDFFVP